MDRRNFPFRNLDNAQLRREVANMNQIIFGNPQRYRSFEETTLPRNHWLGPPEFSNYAYTVQFTINQGAELIQALSGIIRRVYDINGNSRGRFRITYVDQYGRMPPSRRTTRYDRVEDDQLTLLFESIMYLLQSNETLDFPNLVILFDTSRDLEAGGSKSKKMKVESKKYAGKEFVLTVPIDCGQLCGWICLTYHLVRVLPFKHASVSAEFWDATGIKEGLRDKRNANPKLQYLNANPQKLYKAAAVLKTFCGSTNDRFLFDVDAYKYLEKFPQHQLVVYNEYAFVSHIARGKEMEDIFMTGQQLSLEDADKCTVYFLQENTNDGSHFHYTQNFQSFYRSIHKKDRHYMWCHKCLRAFNYRYKEDILNHTCQELTCDKCKMVFDTDEQLENHKKKKLVNDSYNDFVDDAEVEIVQKYLCTQCNTSCYNLACYDQHVSKVCKFKWRKCTECWEKVWTGSSTLHVCNMNAAAKCYTCKQKFTRREIKEHRCSITKLKTPEDVELDNELRDMYSFDFESMLIDRGDYEEHVVNLAIVQNCGTGEKWLFETLEEFVQWIHDTFNNDVEDLENEDDEDDETNKSSILMIAHNFKGYDGRLLFDHMKKTDRVVTNLLMNGAKIMSMQWGNVVFYDSLLHITAALEQFPKIFGLDEEQFVKGYFPYKFNIPENQNYVGPIPGVQYFDPDRMSSNKRRSFLKWHRDQVENDYVYDFKDELIKYCESDVDILAQSLNVYVTEAMNMNSNLNPMRCPTIASYALQVYRTLHMPEHMISVLRKDEAEFARRAFHGGRTDVRRLVKFYTPSDVESGKYAVYQDVQSLYPTVQFYKPLPYGSPKKYLFNHANQPSRDTVNTWFGFVECDLKVVEFQYHPVIVEKKDGKLQADLKDKTKIVLTSTELQYALRNGYELVRVYEYHEYNYSCDLFKSYIQTYLKLKIECSGMPKHIKTDADWDVYFNYHKDQLGVHLDKQNMHKNAGRKQLAKLMLNSLWGKFAQNTDMTYQLIIDPNQILKDSETALIAASLWDNESVNIQKDISYGDKRLLIAKSNGINYGLLRKTNIALATFVTSWGALTLWEEMQKLGDRVLYHDTDSIIYERSPTGYNIPLGVYLGEWEDETGGKPITKFCSIGPKSYSYGYLSKEVSDDDTVEDTFDYNDKSYIIDYVCKCKGFRLNHYNSSKLNFHTLHSLIVNDKSRVVAKDIVFSWGMETDKMITKQRDKVLTFKYDKGIVDKSDFKVYPYGSEKFIEIGQ